ncbi:MAG: hydrogenase expression/formation protein HypE [Planctomycetota bacterium]
MTKEIEDLEPRRKAPKILLAHGGGGLASSELLLRTILPALANPVLEKLGDSAVLDLPSLRLAFTTDSFVVTPVRFPGGDLGRLCVAGTVNDLAVAGARPLALSLACVLPEGFLMEEFASLLASARRTADEVSCPIVTGDTKVMEHAALDSPVFTTSGVGIIELDDPPDATRVRPGDSVLVSGTLGDHAVAVMSAREGLSFDTPVRSDAAPLWPLVERLCRSGAEIRFMRDPTRGGLAAAVNDLARAAGLHVELDEEAIPVSRAVLAACDMLGLDPLNAANEGKILVVVPGADSDRALEALRSHPLGAGASVIGRMTAEPPGVTVRTRLGTSRVLDVPYGEELPRIC